MTIRIVKTCATIALALLFTLTFVGCDGESASVGVDISGGADTATATDTGGAADTGVSPDTAAPVDVVASVDTPATPDTVMPAAGALGGPCKTGRVCDAGECRETPDGNELLCAMECTSNYECPDNLRCEAVADFEMWCLGGPRGTATIGQPCGEGMENGCKSALCIEADPAEAIHVDTCTDTCESDATCAPPYPICYGGVDLCLPILSGDLGGRCSTQGDCVEGTCTLIGDLGQRCTRTCTEGEDCGQPYLSCQEKNSQRFCLMNPWP